ncbi:unnamed protein product [Colias eurytheme]|nr:unnamed protein product [Colias eurytheme]
MKSLIKIVKSYTENSEIENIISGNFANICKEFKKKSKNPQGVRYSDEVKSFALTLHFYSAKAYEFIKQYATLPHVETLRRSLASFNCNVGFLSEVLEYLKLQVQVPEKSYLKNVALIFDGMALKQDLIYDQKLDKVFGYVDLGKIVVSDPEEMATEALVFQIVSYTTHFKCPIAYFFIKNTLHAELLAELLHTAVVLLTEIGITVRSMTCDGAPSNIRAYQFLGCQLQPENFQPYFSHPNGRDKIYCFLDAAHMLKLARNVLAEHEILSPSGSTSYGFIRSLHEVQREEGFKFGNKLSSTHVEYQNKKMNVKLAAQVAESIEFLRLSGNPLFLGSEATSCKRPGSPNENISSLQIKRVKKDKVDISSSSAMNVGDKSQNQTVNKGKKDYNDNKDIPLAEFMRPSLLDDIIGHKESFGPGSMLHAILSKKKIPNMILWGPPGCGKTSIGNVIANVCKEQSNLRFVKLSATMSGINDVKEVVKVAKNEAQFKRHTVLFMDEIHRFNKLQQDTFLPHVENGTITLIGATTENPSFSLNNALLSRCRVIVLEKLTVDDVTKILERSVEQNNLATVVDELEEKVWKILQNVL